jgi:cytochrome c oxidase cbb3-type subunit 3
VNDWYMAAETDLSVQEATDRIERVATEKGLRVLCTHDVSETIRGKGFECCEYRIVEVCNAKYASQAIAADPRVGLWMPCPIAIYEHEGRTHIATVRTIPLAAYFPGSSLGEFATDVEKLLGEILDAGSQP